MAVCFPIFMLILLGIVELGRGLMVSQLLTAAARQGCREAIIDGASNESVVAEIKNSVVSTVGCDAADITVNIAVTSIANGAEIAQISNADQRDLIQINVSVPFDAISYASGRFLNGQDLAGRCAMRKE
jgi:Flp pilus assembly protein TadG